MCFQFESVVCFMELGDLVNDSRYNHQCGIKFLKCVSCIKPTCNHALGPSFAQLCIWHVHHDDVVGCFESINLAFSTANVAVAVKILEQCNQNAECCMKKTKLIL